LLFPDAFSINPSMSATPILAFSILLFATTDPAIPAPPSAKQILAKAEAKAADEHKAIFVVFDASW
jgi:hypothetical protein